MADWLSLSFFRDLLFLGRGAIFNGTLGPGGSLASLGSRGGSTAT